jgi:hypothetical protein
VPPLRVMPSGFFKLLISSLRYYFPVFLSAWPLFLAAPIPHFIVPWLFRVNYVVGWAAVIGSIIYTWYLFTVILYRADARINNIRMSYRGAFATAVQRYLAVLGGNVLFFALLIVVQLAEYAIWLTADVVYSSLALIMLFVVLDAFLFTLVYFAIPIIILEKRHVLPAFAESAKLVRRSWIRTFFVLFTLLMVTLGVAGIGVLLFSDHPMFLITVFDYFYQLIVYPLIISTTLVLYYDLKSREPRLESRTK